MWGVHSGDPAGFRTSGLLSLAAPSDSDTVIEAELHIDTGAGLTDGAIARDTDGAPDTATDPTAQSMATLPLPTASADGDGRLLLSLAGGTLAQLGDYSFDHDDDPLTPPVDQTPPVRELMLVADLPGLDTEQCGAITGVRWETPPLAEISVR